MNSVSPRSLKLLEDIINGAETEDGAFVEQMPHGGTDAIDKAQNMNGEETRDFNDTLNFFEKLERENGCISNGYVGGNGDLSNSHAENGMHEDNLQGIAEESGEESYAITEVSETTADTTTLDDTTSGSTKQNRKCQSKKALFAKRNKHRNYIPKKTSSVQEGSSDRDSLSDLAETMSDSGRIGRRQRKLKKREQMRSFRPLAVEPLETAEERLERKYEELKSLLSGQFSEQTSALNENHIKQMELLRQQYAIASHGLPPTGITVSRSMRLGYKQSGTRRYHPGNKENRHHAGSEDEAYTTIRTLQTTKAGQRNSRARSARTRPLSATRQNQSRSTSREGRKKNTDDRGDKQRNDEGKKSRSRSNSRSRSSSGSPRRMYIPTETYLKNTDNEFIQEWLKKKDIECKHRKAEERKQKRQERKEKIEKRIEKEEKFKDSKKLVQQWMKQKRKEAFQKQAEEKERQKEEAARNAEERARKVAGLHGWRVGKSVFAPVPVQTENSKPRVSRPGTTVEEMQAKEEADVFQGTQEIPQPPVTKYVYRRPVFGKVRLRVKPQTPESSRSPTRKSAEKLLSKEEIEKKQRVSYDEWLQFKRKEDAEKRKEQQRQAQPGQSHPDFERPFLERNVLQGRAISPGGSGPRSPQRTRVINQEEQKQIREKALQRKFMMTNETDDINEDFVRSESPEEALNRAAKNIVSYVLNSLSDEDEVDNNLFVEEDDEVEHEGLANLNVLGSKASLQSRTRPMSASRISVPAPQTSKSPRRPASAQQKPKSPTDSSKSSLPFPPDSGVPVHVQRIQQKLFPDRIWINPEENERPEPQGTDSVEQNETIEPHQERLFGTSNGTALAENDGFASHMTTGQEPNSDSLSSSKKHVSFCEETTIFDEEGSEVEEDVDHWNDENNDDTEDLEQARLLLDILPSNSGTQGVFITGTEES